MRTLVISEMSGFIIIIIFKRNSLAVFLVEDQFPHLSILVHLTYRDLTTFYCNGSNLHIEVSVSPSKSNPGILKDIK